MEIASEISFFLAANPFFLRRHLLVEVFNLGRILFDGTGIPE